MSFMVTDSPGIPRIMNEAGEEIKRGYVGPLSLGADLTLICEVDDGLYSYLGVYLGTPPRNGMEAPFCKEFFFYSQ